MDMRCNGVKDCVDGSDETYAHARCQSRRTTNGTKLVFNVNYKAEAMVTQLLDRDIIKRNVYL